MNEPKPVIDLKTLLLTHVHQYFQNQVFGFHTSLQDMETEKEKDDFIAYCKRIAENGWSNEFNDIPDLELFKPFLTNPRESLRVVDSQVNATIYFLRLYIFKLISEACLQNPESNKDPAWFRNTRGKFNEEFKKLCAAHNGIDYVYAGNKIYTLEDLKKLNQQIRREYDTGSGGTYAIVIFVAVFAAFKLYERDYASNAVKPYLTPAFLLAVFGMLGIMLRQIVRHGQLQFFVNNAARQIQQAQQQPLQPQLMTDRDILKFILLNDDDLTKLEARAPVATPR